MSRKIKIDVATPNQKREELLEYLYHVTGQNPLQDVPFDQIGTDLGWPQEEVIHYGEWLERKGLAEFAVFGKLTITQAGIDRVEDVVESHQSPLTRAGRTVVAAGKAIG